MTSGMYFKYISSGKGWQLWTSAKTFAGPFPRSKEMLVDR
jgi:hypothetical protein